MRWLPLLALLLVACTPRVPVEELTSRITKLNARYEAVQRQISGYRDKRYYRMRDMRGRTMADDLDQWVLTPATHAEIQALRERALSSGTLAPLEQADALLTTEALRATNISDYWRLYPAPFWRKQWQAFVSANAASERAPPDALVTLDKQLVAQLEAGDFQAASQTTGRPLIALFRDSRSSLAREFLRADKGQARFVGRKSPCGPAVSPARSNLKAKYVSGMAVEDIYPQGPKQRGEEGSVILRIRVSAAGCATASAVVVHSGHAELDAAAQQWVETAVFSPAYDQGRGAESQVPFMMTFKLEE